MKLYYKPAIPASLFGGSPSLRRECGDELGKLLRTLERDGVVVTCSNSSHGTVAFQPSQAQGSSLLQEGLLCEITTGDPEADIHT